MNLTDPMAAPRAPVDLPTPILARDLARALKQVVGIVEARNSIPVLSHLLIQADGDSLTLTATNLDLWASIRVEAPGAGTWEATAPAKTLQRLCAGSCATDSVAFTPDSETGRLAVAFTPEKVARGPQGGANVTHLPMLAPSDFPRLAREAAAGFTIPAADLRAVAAGVAPYMSKSEARYHLNGACLDIAPPTDSAWEVPPGVNPRAAVLVATDGDRLGKRELDIRPDGLFPRCIIPRRAIEWIAKTLPNDTGPVRVSYLAPGEEGGAPGVQVAHDSGLTLTTKLIDGHFPDWRRVMPDDAGPAVRLNVADLRSGLELVATIAGGVRRTRVEVTLDGSDVRLACECDGASGETLLFADPEEGAALALPVDAGLLLGALKAFGRREEVTLRQLATGMLVIRAVADASRESVVMGMKGAVKGVPMVDSRLPRPIATIERPHMVTAYETDAEGRFSRVDKGFGYLLTTRAWVIRAPESREFLFPSYAAACRAWLRQVAGLEASAVLTVEGGGFQGHEPGAAVIWLEETARGAEYQRRRAAIQDAQRGYDDSQEGDSPWPRKVIGLVDFPDLNATPGATLRSGFHTRKVLTDRARKHLAPGENPWRERDAADRLTRVASDAADASRVLRMELLEAAEAEARAARAALPRVRIWASEAGAWGYAPTGEPFGPFQFSGLGSREAAAMHAIKAHPFSRVVISAHLPESSGSPAPNVVAFRRIPARFSGASRSVIARAV